MWINPPPRKLGADKLANLDHCVGKLGLEMFMEQSICMYCRALYIDTREDLVSPHCAPKAYMTRVYRVGLLQCLFLKTALL